MSRSASKEETFILACIGCLVSTHILVFGGTTLLCKRYTEKPKPRKGKLISSKYKMTPLVMILALSLMAAVDGLCKRDAPTCQVIADCEYKGKIIPRGSKKTFYGNTCMECECADNGSLGCCGIGYNAGVMSFEGCKVKTLRKCRYTFVRANNKRKLCPTKTKPTKYYIPRPYTF